MRGFVSQEAEEPEGRQFKSKLFGTQILEVSVSTRTLKEKERWGGGVEGGKERVTSESTHISSANVEGRDAHLHTCLTASHICQRHRNSSLPGGVAGERGRARREERTK